MKYKSTLLTFSLQKEKLHSLIACSVCLHTSKELALGSIYNRYNISYVREKDQEFICCNFQFGWSPTRITVVIVQPSKSIEMPVHINLQDKITRKRINELLEELIKTNRERNWGGCNTLYPDMSIKMSDWHWQHTIPKGYTILQPGEIILETDREYDTISSKNKFWMEGVSWYNVGKTVREWHTWSYLDENGNITQEGISHPNPLICRRIEIKGRTTNGASQGTPNR